MKRNRFPYIYCKGNQQSYLVAFNDDDDDDDDEP